MAEELQGLLNRIQEDGLQKSEAERAKIIADATSKAEKIIADAKAQAEETGKAARIAAEAMEAKARATIQQAARDILIALRTDLLKRLNDLVKQSSGAAMTPDLMTKLITEMAAAYGKNTEADRVEVLLPAASLQAMETGLKAALADDLRNRTDILAGQDFGGGLKIGFRGGDVFLDFSDEALSEIICAYVGPKIAAILKG